MATTSLMAPGKRRAELGLLQQWKEAVRTTYLPFLMIKAFPNIAEFTHQPCNKFILLEIQFDYNFRTFLPVRPPTLNSIGVLPPVIQQQMQTIWRASPPAGHCDHVVLLKQKDNDAVSVMPCRIPIAAFKLQHPFDRLLQMIRKDIHLRSSQFDSWLPQKKLNILKQCDLFRCRILVQFLSAALHLDTSTPRHVTHAVTFLVDVGLGLGEIRTLRDFHVVPVENLRKGVKSHPSLGRDQKDYYLKDVLNLDGTAPSVKEAEKGSVLLPVVFVSSLTKDILYIQPNFTVYDADKSPEAEVTPEEADKQARSLFTQLFSVPIPPVQSPKIKF